MQPSGDAGTIGQHSFHQLLHQGTENIPVDFILPLQSPENEHKQAHLAKLLAQRKALTEGKTIDAAEQELLDNGASVEEAKRLGAHKASPGNRPNTIITMEKLTPSNLGALRMYEPKFCQSGMGY